MNSRSTPPRWALHRMLFLAFTIGLALAATSGTLALGTAQASIVNAVATVPLQATSSDAKQVLLEADSGLDVGPGQCEPTLVAHPEGGANRADDSAGVTSFVEWVGEQDSAEPASDPQRVPVTRTGLGAGE